MATAGWPVRLAAAVAALGVASVAIFMALSIVCVLCVAGWQMAGYSQ